jgi:hypothetical protein
MVLSSLARWGLHPRSNQKGLGSLPERHGVLAGRQHHFDADRERCLPVAGPRLRRKGLEAYFTAPIEFAWGERRIVEIYLNVAEWGPGVYGAEAAAQYYFHKPANAVTSDEAVRLAAALPDPVD